MIFILLSEVFIIDEPIHQISHHYPNCGFIMTCRQDGRRTKRRFMDAEKEDMRLVDESEEDAEERIK